MVDESWLAASENPFEKSSTATLDAVDLPWQVVVMNDPVNLMNYVILVFEKVFGYEREKATRHMREVHELGRSVLWTGSLEKAEAYVYTLQGWQLTAVLEQTKEG